MGSFSLGVIVGLCLAVADRLAAAERRDRAPSPPVGRATGRSVGVYPSQLSLSQWRRVVVRSFKDFGRDRIAQSAAGVTFYTLLSLFPAISAFVSLYGLVANAADARGQIQKLEGLLPGGGVSVLSSEIQRLTSTDHGALGFAFVVSIAVSIWSASSGVKALIDGLNVAFERTESRSFVRLTLLSLGFTLGAIAVAGAGLAVTVAAPALFSALPIAAAKTFSLLRWPALLVAAGLAISVLYRFGPDRPNARWRWITPGSCVAAVGWIVMSGAFSWYVANFGHYNKTYGSLGAIVGFLTWIWLSLMVVLYGAELNDEIEKEANAGRAA